MKIVYLELNVWPHDVTFEERNAFEWEWAQPKLRKKAYQEEMTRITKLY